MKIISIVGARPQFVKLAPLSRQIRKRHDEIIMHTGQHYDHEMSDIFFKQLDIPLPSINLDVGSSSHGAQTGSMLAGIEYEINRIKPDVVLSFGDTNSTLAACLAASKLHVPSVHIEAGLRSFNRNMPEEINRIVADHTADHLFASTSLAIKNLKREGLEERSVLTGDIMVDTFYYVKNKFSEEGAIDTDYLLMTLHRPYNVDDINNLKDLFSKLKNVSHKIIFPSHPRTLKMLCDHNMSIPENIEIIEPQGYVDFQFLLRNAKKVITDSGGLQKEAYIAGKPCITLRPETEWVETVDAGWNILLDIQDLLLVSKIVNFNPSSVQPNLYGTEVAKKMVQEIENLCAYL